MCMCLFASEHQGGLAGEWETYDHELDKRTQDLGRSFGQIGGPCWSSRDPHMCLCMLVNPRNGACMCGFTSELLPLPAAEEEGTWLLTLR